MINIYSSSLKRLLVAKRGVRNFSNPIKQQRDVLKRTEETQAYATDRASSQWQPAEIQEGREQRAALDYGAIFIFLCFETQIFNCAE